MTALIIQSLSSAAQSAGEFVKFYKFTHWFSNFGEYLIIFLSIKREKLLSIKHLGHPLPKWLMR